MQQVRQIDDVNLMQRIIDRSDHLEHVVKTLLYLIFTIIRVTGTKQIFQHQLVLCQPLEYDDIFNDVLMFNDQLLFVSIKY